MTRRNFLGLSALAAAALAIPSRLMALAQPPIRLRLLRHATLVLEIGGRRLLVDPMLAPKGAMDPVGNAANSTRIPMVDLPLDDTELATLLRKVDAVLVTHTHRDHWDAAAIERIAKDKPILAPAHAAAAIREKGFGQVVEVPEAGLDWKGLTLWRTGGQHGTGEIGAKMGPVSGFVVTAGRGKVYIAGDTIYCAEVEAALRQHQPEWVVVNAGAAQFLTGDPITMTAADVQKTAEALPTAQVIAVHMETVNHCLLMRSQLAEAMHRVGLAQRVRIPADGERLGLQ